MKELGEAVALIANIKDLAHVVLSGRRRNFNVEHVRIDIRPVQLKNELCYQMAFSDGRKVTTKNFSKNDFNIEKLLLSGYANITIRHSSGEYSARFTKKDQLLVSRKAGQFKVEIEHDRKKARLLSSDDPYLKYLGISDSDGVIKPTRMAKYLQIEEFLRLVTPKILYSTDTLRIIDLGAGSGYLTFAIHQYLHQLGLDAKVIGVDIRSEFAAKNAAIARELGISSTMEFKTSSIAELPIFEVDIVIALHACDTATDEALAWAIKSGAKEIFVAPCCHHDIQRQIKSAPAPWEIVTAQGILRERLGDLITDALRIELLKASGYSCDAVEFIGGEHTPRNVMIRAHRTQKKSTLDSYNAMTAEWGISSALQRMLETDRL